MLMHEEICCSSTAVGGLAVAQAACCTCSRVAFYPLFICSSYLEIVSNRAHGQVSALFHYHADQ